MRKKRQKACQEPEVEDGSKETVFQTNRASLRHMSIHRDRGCRHKTCSNQTRAQYREEVDTESHP